MSASPAISASAELDRLAGQRWDVLVVGGGIVGAGVVRDAAMRGLKAALIDRYDFAFGTSSRSSRLLHGGLRYLAQGRLGLVREASVEKCVLHRIAPHLAAPLPFLFPTYRGTPWARWKLSIGVRIYDLLCGRRNLGPCSTLSVDETLEKLPGLNHENLTGGVRYYDGLTSDARLVFDTLRSAERHGALLRNHIEFQDAARSADGWTTQLQDGRTGRQLRVAAAAVVNATGCWAAQIPHSRVRLRLTKGIHLVVDQARFPVPEAVVMAEGDRILFAIPWGQRTILGTTDTDYDGALDDVPTDAADVAYVLRVTNSTFPQAKLAPADVLSYWAGVRPLISEGEVVQGAPSDTSRNHQIRMPEPGWIDVAGGKLTTYRLMAEQTIDMLARALRRDLPECRTADEPLVEASQATNLSNVIPPAVTRGAVAHYCAQEWALALSDVMFRRTGWAYYCRNAPEIAEEVSRWMAELLGWSAEQQAAELAEYRRVTRPVNAG